MSTDAVHAQVGNRGLWLGHRTWLLDGSSCSMPDTPQLQAAFGQSGQQKAGCGFPTAHLAGDVRRLQWNADAGACRALKRTSDFSLVSTCCTR